MFGQLWIKQTLKDSELDVVCRFLPIVWITQYVSCILPCTGCNTESTHFRSGVIVELCITPDRLKQAKNESSEVEGNNGHVPHIC